MGIRAVIEIIRNIIKSLSNRAYLFSLLLSIVFWCLIRFSRDYTASLNFDIRFLNQPDSTILLDYSPKELTVQVKGQGFSLLSYYFRSNVIDVDLSGVEEDQDGWYLWETNAHFSDIVKQFAKKEQIDKINTDRVRLKLQKLARKRIPVRLNNKLLLQNGFVLDEIVLNPDTIEILAPGEELAKLDFFDLKIAVENPLSEDMSFTIPLNYPEHWNINITEVRLDVKMDKLTQQKLKVPIQVTNVPDTSKAKLFPDEVELLFNVPTRFYHQINAQDFLVRADFQRVGSGDGKVYLELVKYPEQIELMVMKPQEADYLLIYE